MTTDEHTGDESGTDGPIDHNSVAQDRFIHGLLGFVYKETKTTQEQRVAGVLDRIQNAPVQPRGNRSRIFSRFAPFASAAVLLISVLTFFVVSMQSSAYAMMDEAIRATRQAEQLRYEIRFKDPAWYAGEEQTIGILDMRGDFMRVQIDMPQGHVYVLGRDQQGEWSIGAEGMLERHTPRAGAPRWINLGESTILIGSLDALLDELRKDQYSIDRVEDTKQSTPNDKLTQLTATKLDRTTPGPGRVQIWIHDETSLVETLEFHWERSKPPAHRAPPPNPPRPGLLSHPPSFREDGDPPPPERIVFQRMPTEDLPAAFFSPPEP